MDKVDNILSKSLLQTVVLLLLTGMQHKFEKRNSVVTIVPLVSSSGQCNCQGTMYGRASVDVSEIDSGVRKSANLLWPLSFKNHVSA